MPLYRPCPLCGQDAPHLWFAPARRQAALVQSEYAFQPPLPPGPVVRCGVCGLVYVNPIERFEYLICDAPTLDGRSPALLESANLDDVRGSPEEASIAAYMAELAPKQADARQALNQLNLWAKTRGRLLDVGCYCGIFLAEAVRQGWDAYGLEPSVMHAIWARGRFGLRVVTDVLREDTFPPASFEAATAFQVLEHLVEPARMLDILYRILSPGGVILVEVPNIDNLTVRLLGRHHRHFVADHVSYFTPRTLALLLAKAGFQPCAVFYPTRTLRWMHLLQWLSRYVGPSLTGALKEGLARTRQQSRTVRLNFHDILTIIARKL